MNYDDWKTACPPAAPDPPEEVLDDTNEALDQIEALVEDMSRWWSPLDIDGTTHALGEIERAVQRMRKVVDG